MSESRYNRKKRYYAMKNETELRRPHAGTLHVVIMDIDDPADGIRRSSALLRAVDLIILDEEDRQLSSPVPGILDSHAVHTRFVYCKAERLDGFVRLLCSGKSAALLTFATAKKRVYEDSPEFVLDRNLGSLLIRMALREMVDVVGVPSVPVTKAALKLSGFPARSFVVDWLFGHNEESRTMWSKISQAVRTTVLFAWLSMDLPSIMGGIGHPGFEGFHDRKAVLCLDLKRPTERVIRTPIGELEELLKGPSLQGTVELTYVTIVVEPGFETCGNAAMAEYYGRLMLMTGLDDEQ